VTTFCVVREEPMSAVTLALLLAALAENCGADLWRMKGIIHVTERPDCPAVIHGVQHVYHAPLWLPRWPSGDRRSRIVFIGHGIRESWVRRLIDLIEDEVADESTRW
jgi:G3E family GTPase